MCLVNCLLTQFAGRYVERRIDLDDRRRIGRTSGSSAGKILVSFSPQMAGFPPESRHHVPEPEPAAVWPGALDWMSDELIADTRRVWSSAYGRVISADEALEILRNVRRFAEVLVQSQGE
jgi:hypothetical protein